MLAQLVAKGQSVFLGIGASSLGGSGFIRKSFFLGEGGETSPIGGLLRTHSHGGSNLGFVLRALSRDSFGIRREAVRICCCAQPGLLGCLGGCGCGLLVSLFFAAFGSLFGGFPLLHDTDPAGILSFLRGFTSHCNEFFFVLALVIAIRIFHDDGYLGHHIGSILVRSLRLRDRAGSASLASRN